MPYWYETNGIGKRILSTFSECLLDFENDLLINIHIDVLAWNYFKGSQLAKMKKYIPYSHVPAIKFIG